MEITLAGLANSKSIFVFTDHVRSSLGRSFLSSNLSGLNGGFLSGGSSLNSGGSSNDSWGSSKGESGSNESSNLGRVVDDVGGDSVGGLGVNMDLGDVVDLVVNLSSNVPDHRGGDHLFLDSVDRDNGLVDGVMDSGDRGSSIGNSWGSNSMDSWGGNSVDSWGGNSMDSWGSSIGKSGSRGNSGSSGIFGLNSGSGKNSSCVGSNSCKTNSSKTNTSQTSVSSSKELSISFSSRGSQGRGHEGRQSDEGLHCDLC